MTSFTSPSIGECTICLSDLTPSNTYAITKCGHTFHGKCIQKWLRVNENGEEVLSDIESDWDDLNDLEDLPLESNAIIETENRAIRYINPQLVILATECLLRLIIYYLKK
uniref:RING-type domain-containing protein n=1 Tax=Panagrolaimus davidi TaxID=227884 RepID=A0A914PHP9_9BILA